MVDPNHHRQEVEPMLVQPPTHETCQSPNHEPRVTGMRSRMNLVSNCIKEFLRNARRSRTAAG